MKNSALILISSLTALLLASCASTPQSRIKSNPATYAALSAEDKQLVEAGQIREGMTPQAAFLAWGNPSQEITGLEDDKAYTEWRYIDYRTVSSNSFHGSFGYGNGFGHGRFGKFGRRGFRRGGFGHSGFGIGHTVTNIPELKARIWFDDNKVVGYRRSR